MINDDEEFYSLLSRRNSGKVTYGFEDRNNIEDEELKEGFLKRMGHNPKKIKGNWKQVNKSYAKNILTYTLSKNMTHNIDLETKPLAEKLSNYFLDKFQPEAVFYTNGQFNSNSGYFKLYAWTTITSSKFYTYDTGIVVFDNDKIGMLWATDPL